MAEDRRSALERRIGSLSPEKQELLRARLAGKAEHTFSDELRPGIGGPGGHPLSQTQQGFWFMGQLEQGGHMFNLPSVMRIHGALQVPVLERVLAEIMRRHDVLRSRVVLRGGEPAVIVDEDARPVLREIDLCAFTESHGEAEVRRLATEEARAPFQLAVDPPLRALVIHERPEQSVLCFTFHHIACDGWSIELFVKEAVTLYHAFAAGQDSPLPKLEWRYADYVAWQRRHLSPERLEQQLAHWRRTLQSAPELIELPLDRPRKPLPSHDGSVAVSVVGREDVERVTAYARHAGITPFVIYLGAFGLLLGRYAGQEEVVIGTPVFNRTRKEFEQLIGLFINTVVIRCDLQGNPSVREYLTQRLHRQLLDAFTHQDVPFHRVVRELGVQRHVSYSPLFQVLFSYQSYSNDSNEGIEGLRIRPLEGLDAKATYDLTLELRNREDGTLAVFAEFASELFDRGTVIRLLNHYTRLLHAMIENPERCLSELSLLSAAERQLLLLDWNRTRAAYPENATYQQLFADVARQQPAACGTAEGKLELSYAELAERADALASCLSSHGAGANRLVALVQERGIPLLTSILATFRANAGYVPVDPGFPPERLGEILRRSEAPVILASEAYEPMLQGLVATGALPARPTILYYERLALSGASAPRDSAPADGTANDLAYCIFTSGSTGIPKGALIEQRGMLNHMYAKIADLSLTHDDVLAATASPSFDISVWQYLTALLVGGKVVFFDDETTHAAKPFIRRLVEHGITVAEVVPSFFRFVLEELEELGDRRPSFHRLRWMLLTGEALPAALCRRWLALYPSIPIVNAYGPTECSDDVTHHFVREAPTSGSETVPIGRPLANTQIYIVDQNFEPVPVGVVGEIIVGGTGVGRGYLNDPERTAEVFVPDPFVRGPGRRVYRTRDLGRWRPDSAIEFLGRVDHQLKIRGFRIEPGEVEAALARHPALSRAVVLARQDDGAEKQLVAYLVPEGGVDSAPSPAELRAFLKQKLPEYMVPAAFVVLDTLPLTANGKLNRAALPAPKHAAETADADGSAAPTDAVEEVLARIWAEALNRERVGVHDDFFALGGHSLLAVELVHRVEKAFRIQLSVRELFGATTVAKLARLVQEVLRDGAFSVLDTRDLETEAALDAAIRPSSLDVQFPAEPRRIFLTGATGFLGSFLLHELLEQTNAEVYCLVRAEREEDAKRRIQNALEARKLWQQGRSSRITAVPGDLELPRFGLSARQFDALANKMEVVYHCAARINLLYPYSALKDVNVVGTQEVLRLAVSHRTKPVHHISSLSVFSLASSATDVVPEDARLDSAEGLHGGYAQSKWVADRMVTSAGERGVPVAIYRPHRITGHSQTGSWNAEDLVCQVLNACLRTGVVPDRETLVQMTPVDYVSRAIVHLSRQKSSMGRAFHLMNEHGAPLQAVVGWIRDMGYPLETVPRAEWQARVFEEARRSPESALYPLGYLMSDHGAPDAPGPEELSSPKRRLQFDCSKTAQALSETNIGCRPVDRALIEGAVSYLVRSGMIEPPRRADLLVAAEAS